MSLIGSVSSVLPMAYKPKEKFLEKANVIGEGVSGSQQDVPRTEVAPQTVTAKAPDTSRGFLV